MLVETLRADWTARGANARVCALPEFDGGALTLGAGTRVGLAKRGLLSRKHDSEAFDEARVVALLAAIYGRAIAPSELAYVRGAPEKQSEGQKSLALVYLALAGLPKQ